MNLQPTSIALITWRSSLCPLDTDRKETWKEYRISQQVCEAEFAKPLQKPAHSDLCHWCLSPRRAKPPGNGVDQAPRTKRTGQTFPTAGTCRAVHGGSQGAWAKTHRVIAAAAYVQHGAPGIAPFYTISKRRTASKLKWTEQSIQKSLEQNQELTDGFLFWQPEGSCSSGVKERAPSHFQLWL